MKTIKTNFILLYAIIGGLILLLILLPFTLIKKIIYRIDRYLLRFGLYLDNITKDL